MLLCILYTVCYLINHKCTMLLTFVCSIFNFFFLYLTTSFCFHLFSLYALLKFPSLSNSTIVHKTDCLRKFSTVFAPCLLSWGRLSQLSLSSGSSLVWWLSMSAVQMSLWNFFHHPFISVLRYVFCFLDSISPFFFVYFFAPIEVNCFGNYTFTLPNFSSPARACEAWPFGYVKQALPLRGLGVVLLLSSLELATLFPRTGSIAYSGPNRRCNRRRCRRRRQVGYRCLSKTPTTLRIERSLASIDETRGKGCHPSCGIEQRLLGLGC